MNATTTPLRIGFVGAGGNTRSRHLPAFKRLPNVELVAVANRSVASSQAVVDAFGIGRVEADWRAIVAAPDVDAVCIGTWPYLHAEITCAALAAGKHVLTEARMACNLNEAECMQAAAQAAPGCVAQIVPAPFTLVYDAVIRRWLQSGRLGDLLRVNVNHKHGGMVDPSTPITWRQRTGFSGHNLMTLGIHYEALLRWLDDDAIVEAARGAIATEKRPDENGHLQTVDIPDMVSMFGFFPRSGARLNLTLSGLEVAGPCNEIRLTGSQGALHLNLATRELWFTATGGVPELIAPEAVADAEPDGWRVEADFVDSIREGRAVTHTNFATGLRYMQFTDAVWAALAE